MCSGRLKKGGPRCGHRSKKGGLRCRSNSKKGGVLGAGQVKRGVFTAADAIGLELILTSSFCYNNGGNIYPFP